MSFTMVALNRPLSLSRLTDTATGPLDARWGRTPQKEEPARKPVLGWVVLPIRSALVAQQTARRSVSPALPDLAGRAPHALASIAIAAGSLAFGDAHGAVLKVGLEALRLIQAVLVAVFLDHLVCDESEKVICLLLIDIEVISLLQVQHQGAVLEFLERVATAPVGGALASGMVH